MQIAVWYPARASSAASMRFSDLVALLASEIDFRPPDASRREAAAELFVTTTAEYGGDAANVRGRLLDLLRLELASVEEAKPAAGTFPVLLSPGYRPYPTQNVLAEYLASHGVVVAAFAMKGSVSLEPEISLAGLETLVADMQFVLGEVRRLPFMDGRRAAAAGVGFNATTREGGRRAVGQWKVVRSHRKPE